MNLDDNLFEPLTEEARRAFERGDGGELHPDVLGEGNMHALHSSSAAACNLLHYWHSRGDLVPLTAACGLPRGHAARLRFEAKHPIVNGDARFPRSPNLDAEIVYERGKLRAAGIECKLCEPYGRPHKGLSERYLELDDRWAGIPNLYEVARSISPDDRRFRHFDAAQVLKHVLGLATSFGLDRFCLLYLWYEAPGAEAQRLRAEITEFAEAAHEDGIDFRSTTYQDVILRLARVRDQHSAYVDYLGERYL